MTTFVFFPILDLNKIEHFPSFLRLPLGADIAGAQFQGNTLVCISCPLLTLWTDKLPVFLRILSGWALALNLSP